MNVLKKEILSRKINKSGIFVVRYLLCSFITFFMAFLLLKFPALSVAGVKKGIEVCTESLIPSLYPFMIITNAYILSPVSEMKLPPLEKLCRFLFGLPGSAGAVILFSFTAGLPVGAEMSAGLYRKGIISRQECSRLLCFCVNPGPAFVISAVGNGMLGSSAAGALIYASLVISSLIIGFSTRFFATENETYISLPSQVRTGESGTGSIEKAVVKSSRAIFNVCAWVVAFSCLSEIIGNSGLPEGAKAFLLCTSEITNGSLIASEKFTVPVVASVIGFSGFCGHLQIMGAINTAEMEYKYFLVSRIINSALAAVICSLLMRLFPVARETFSVGIKPDGRATSGSVVLSVLMLIMAVLFVIGDDYKLNRKKSEKV
ncbi:MAG: hypothetical protein E7543_08200 [Ruminococcaceae bacterium]|nr:hypothetical protein [Oscillospiraceae bacterium]